MIVMDDFEFPVLQGEEEQLVHPPQLAEDDDSEAVPFHRLVGLPTDQLPKTAPRTSSTGTIGDALRGIQAPKWGSTSRARLPTSTGAPPAGATPAVPSQSSGGSSASAAPVAAVHGGAAGPSHSGGADSTLGGRDANSSAQGNAQRWMPTQKRQTPWSDDETDVFYDGIAQFGTNFSAIAVLLVHRTRNEVLLKYKQELQKRPDRMANALLPSQRKAVDLARFTECKQKYDALQAPPVQALNAEEEAHLLAINEELGQSNVVSATATSTAPATVPHARVGPSRRADKSAGTSASAPGASAAADGVAPPSTVTQPNVDREFLFGGDEDEDVPLAELYGVRRPAVIHPSRAKRAGEASPSLQVASPHTASPLTNTSTGTATATSNSSRRAKKQPRPAESQSPSTSRAVTNETSETQKSRSKAASQSEAHPAGSSGAVDPKATASSTAAGRSQEAASNQPARKRARTAAGGSDTPQHDAAHSEKPVSTGSATSPVTETKKRKSHQRGPEVKSSSRRRGSRSDAQKAPIAEEFDFETSLTTATSSTHANERHVFPATLPDLPDEDNQDLVLDAPEDSWMDDDTLF